MDAVRISKMLIQYERYKSMCDPVRFASTHWFQQLFPEVYAMDPRMFTAPPSERFQSLLQKNDITDALLALLLQDPGADGPLRAALGVPAEAIAAALRALDPIKKPIPDKTVVITFDDAGKDHFTHAAPVLTRLGFGATFFVTEPEPGPMGSGFEDKTRYMDWAQIAELHAMGFEIGNHTLHHRRPGPDFDREDFTREIEGLNERAEAHGIPRPTSFAYAFGGCTPDQMAAAADCGMRWARGNVTDGVCRTGGKTVYDPLWDDPLSVPSYGDAPLYSRERLERRVAQARDGKILCLAFHSVTDPVEWGVAGVGFEAYMEHLAALGCHVIGLGQLEEYIDPRIARSRFLP